MELCIKAVSKILKFLALAVITAFCVLSADCYYALDAYAQKLYSGLAVTVFIGGGCKDHSKLCREIEDSGILSLDEYVPSSQAYSRAVEKNPFLKDISVPGDAQVFPAYARFVPAVFPGDGYLAGAAKMLASMDDVEEAVYDEASFEKYARLKNELSFYKAAALLFAIIIFMFCAVRAVLHILKKEEPPKKTAANAAACLIACAVGFTVVWGVCVFFQRELFIGETAAFLTILLTASFGIIFKD
jgi:cell division transport system permease protein